MINDVTRPMRNSTTLEGRGHLTEHPLLWHDRAALRPSAAVPPDADACLPHGFGDGSSAELDQLHQTLSGGLGVLGYEHGGLALEQVLLVLPGRQVPLETTDLRGEVDGWVLFWCEWTTCQWKNKNKKKPIFCKWSYISLKMCFL